MFETVLRARRRALIMAALAPTLAALAPTAAYATDGYFLNGTGAKAKGAGGVEIAMPQDSLSIAVNPANATDLDSQLDIGLEVFVPRRGAAISGNQAGLDGTYSGNGSNPFVLPEFGYVRKISDRVSVGLTISGNGGMNTHYNTSPFSGFGDTGPAGVNLRQVIVSPTIGYKVAPSHAIGFSPTVVIQSFAMTGAVPFSGYSVAPDSFTNNGDSWATGTGFRLGYLGTLTSAIKVGAFYQSKIHSSRFKKYAGLFADGGKFDVPPAWGAGVSLKPMATLTLGADFKRIEYSKVAAVGHPMGMLFQGFAFGSENGPGFGWRDINVWKIGAVYQAGPGFVLRGGYGRSDNPVPQGETLLNVLAPGVVRGHLTAGASIDLSPTSDLTGYIMHAPSQTVHGSGSIPPGMPQAGFGGGEADVHLSETAFGFSFGLKM